MIDLDRPLFVEGISLYGDHRDPLTWHVLPGPPTVAGTPTVWLWRDAEGRAGGFLQLTITFAVPEEALAAVRSALGDDANLVPVTIDRGEVTLHVPEHPGIRARGGGTIGLAAPWASLHALELDPEAATLLADRVETGGTLPFTVVAEVRLRGLQPARRTRIVADVSACHTVLGERFGVDTPWARADVSRAVEALRTEGHVVVEDMTNDGEDPAAHREALDRLVEELLTAELWSPAPPAPAAPAAPAALRFSLRRAQADEARVRTWDFSATTVRERVIYPQGAVSLAMGAVRRLALEASELAGPPRPVVVEAPPGADWTGVERVQVDLRAGDAEASVLLDAASPRAERNLPDGPLQARLRAFVTPEPDALGVPADAPSEWAPLDGRLLPVDPAALAARREVWVELDAGGDGATVAAEVRLADGTGSRALRLDAAAPAGTFVVRGTGPVSLRAVVELVPDGGARRELVVERVLGPDERRVFVAPPPDVLRWVTFAFVDPLRRYDSVTVLVEDPPRALRLDASHPRTRIARLDAGGVRFRERRVRRDGGLVEGAPREVDSGLVLVGDPGLRLVSVEVILRGLPDHIGGLLRVAPDPVAGEALPAVDALVDPGVERARVQVPAAAAGVRATVTAQVFDAEGGVLELGPARVEGDTVIVLAPA